MANKWTDAIISCIVFNDMFPLTQQSGVLSPLSRPRAIIVAGRKYIGDSTPG